MVTASGADSKRIVHTQCPMCGSDHIQAHLEVCDYSISKEIFNLWKCTDCAFLFTQDPPSETECGRYYESEDYISHSDKKVSFTDKLYHLARDYMLGRKWRLVKKYSKKRFKGDLLDYGSGTGYFLNYVSNKGWTVDGIEISQSARNFCKETFGIKAKTPETLFKSQKKYDTITLWHVLEHLYDFHKYMKQFRKLLKEDGTLIIAVPNHQSSDAQKYGKYWAAFDVPRHLWHFSPKDFENIATQHGFNLISKHGMPLDALYVSILSERYKSGDGLIAGLIHGFTSNLTALGDPDRFSSMIYILKKQKA